MQWNLAGAHRHSGWFLIMKYIETVNIDIGLQNNNALVITSSQGLGKGIAVFLLREGANVMLSVRSEEKLVAV